ncbi:MAG: dTMP kinase [Elusimicrobia bacterium]|nr:dTMP kinase [Elusimicrobiota bacterium]
MRKRGRFIVLEGPDKSGKSTQARSLVEKLKALKVPVLHTREPGGTSFAEEIRRILLDPAHKVEPLAELLLYEAARAQHTEETLRPALRSGRLVVCERYTLSTEVYQGFARGLDRGLVERANALATGGLKPDLTVVFDLPASEFDSRDASRRHDRLEREPAAFRRKVRLGYQRLAPRSALVLDGRRPASELSAALFERVKRLFE